jgi:serine/tyrosine/threonine adenylyltransferase
VLTRNTKVIRERVEPGAIVCRFAPSWLRIGTFDILRARGDRKLIRELSDYLATHVFSGWDNLPSHALSQPPASFKPDDDTPPLEEPLHVNRYTRLYRHIALLNARTVAAWQAYGFTNGVLNTDNTSLLGLSLDFGPFAFIDNFDPAYTPNHDDHMLRYAYRNQPSIIWWNLVRLGEDMGELLGAGPRVDDPEFISTGVTESWVTELIGRAEKIIASVGAEYQAEFLKEYKRLMTARLGLKTQRDSDFDKLFSSLLNNLEALELDFTHFFRRLSNLPLSELDSDSKRKQAASVFFHAEGMTSSGISDSDARERIASWLDHWRDRILEDWASEQPEDTETLSFDPERQKAMKSVNPKFIPRGWVLDEVIRMVEHGRDKDVLKRIMRMVADPFQESWGSSAAERDEEEKWCGEVPTLGRGIMCSCSS